MVGEENSYSLPSFKVPLMHHEPRRLGTFLGSISQNRPIHFKFCICCSIRPVRSAVLIPIWISSPYIHFNPQSHCLLRYPCRYCTCLLLQCPSSFPCAASSSASLARSGMAMFLFFFCAFSSLPYCQPLFRVYDAQFPPHQKKKKTIKTDDSPCHICIIQSKLIIGRRIRRTVWWVSQLFHVAMQLILLTTGFQTFPDQGSEERRKATWASSSG